jgi:RNA polymerase sigma-70 factor, ECF subfamily
MTFDALYERHGRGIRLYVARLVGDGDAEDLTHDVFERAQRAFRGYRGEARVSTWLYRIATHAAVDWLRSSSIHQRRLESAISADADRAEGGDRPDRALSRNEMRRCILNLVDELPQSQRAVVLLGELRGLSDREVGDALGITVGAAKIRLHRARTELRKRITCACRLYRDEQSELACEPVRAARLR